MKLFTMHQVCQQTGLSYETLKYYCNQGLVPNVKRDNNNHRVFDQYDINWIKDLVCLKKCNMTIVEMKTYLQLCLQGPSSIDTRLEMIAIKKQELQQQIEQLQESIHYIEWKENLYDDFKTGRKPYISNLIPPKK